MDITKLQQDIEAILEVKFTGENYILNKEPFEDIIKRELAKPWEDIPREFQIEFIYQLHNEYSSIGESYSCFADMDKEELNTFNTIKAFLKSIGIEVETYQ